MATLVESLLIVSFFIFFGILLAYLFYFIHERIHQGPRRQQLWDMFVGPSARDESECKPDPDTIGIEPNDEPNVNPIPIPLELNRTMKLNPSQIPEIMPVNCT
jgi:hypothetical protein